MVVNDNIIFLHGSLAS